MPTIESIILTDIVPQKSRGLWQGVINLIFTLGCAVGSLFASVVAESFGWRWVFLGQVPICLLAFVVCMAFLGLPVVRDHRSRLASLRHLDFLGMLLLVAAISSLMFGFHYGGNDSWTSPVVLSCFIASSGILMMYVVVETWFASEPLTPSYLVFSRLLLYPYLTTLFGFAAWMAVLFHMPLYFQARDDESVTVSAYRTLPANFGALVGSFGGGWLMRRANGYYWVAIAGYVVFAASLGLVLVGMKIHDSTMVMVGGALVGLGSGCGIVTSLLALGK